MSDQRPTWQECARVLRDFLNSGNATQFNLSDRNLAVHVIGMNLIRQEEQSKPCRTCGKPMHDFGYFQVSAAGRLLVEALNEQEAAS